MRLTRRAAGVVFDADRKTPLAPLAAAQYRAACPLDIGKHVEVGTGRFRRPKGVAQCFLDFGDSMADIAALTKLIEPEVDALGLKLVRVKMFGGTSDPTLQVMAERPETRQLIIEDCAELSRRLSDVLDAADPIEEAYRLEVSSPGIDRPLTRLSDYADWAGFDARLRFAEPVEGRKQVDGQIEGLDGDTILITTSKTRETVRVPFSVITSGKLLLTDALIKATKPLSTDGADVISVER